MDRFSVLMSVYKNDDPIFFWEAIQSVLNQTRLPDEFLLIADGPVGAELEDVLERAKTSELVRVIVLEHNVGLGASRHVGIQQAAYDIIAVMDADDICVSNRFELQLPILEDGKADLVGGWIEEFNDVPGDMSRVRQVPVEHEEIFRFGKWRQPVNHVTVVFRKELYLKSGGYRPMRYVEDYDLWVRMLTLGVKFYNIPEILVLVRCGTAILERRSGLNYYLDEVSLIVRMYTSGYAPLIQCLANLSVRAVNRLLPRRLLVLIYDKCLRDSRSRPISTSEQ